MQTLNETRGPGRSWFSRVAVGLALAAIALCASVAGAATWTTNAVETADDVGNYASQQLDAQGHPVIAHYDATDEDLKLVHCNDPTCSGADESVETVDGAGNVGEFASLALDAAGNPVISYYSRTGGNLKLAHCNDANCSGADESIQTLESAGNVGWYTSLELDAAGNPVVSYHHRSDRDLKLVRCNDANCAGGDESTETLESSGRVGEWNSLALDADDNPIVAYHTRAGLDLKLARCNDANCAGGDEDVEVVDSAGNVGRFTSLTLDAAGNPTIAYHHRGSRDLRLARVFPDASADPSALAFGDVEVGDTARLSATIESAGEGDLALGAATLTGADAGEFVVEIVGGTCVGATLPALSTCTIEVNLSPTSPGAKTAALEIASNEHDGPLVIGLSGTALAPPEPPLPPDPPPPPSPPGPAAPAAVVDQAGEDADPVPSSAAEASAPAATGSPGRRLPSLESLTSDQTRPRPLDVGLTMGPESNLLPARYRGFLTIRGDHAARPGEQAHVFGPLLQRRRSARLNSVQPRLARLASADVGSDGTFSITFRVRPAGQHYLVIGDGPAESGEPFWVTLRPHLRARLAGRSASLWGRPPQALAGALAIVEERVAGGWARRGVDRLDQFGRGSVRLDEDPRGPLRMVLPADPDNRFVRSTWRVKPTDGAARTAARSSA